MRKNGMYSFIAAPDYQKPDVLLEIIMPEGERSLIITKTRSLARSARDRAREIMQNPPPTPKWKRPNIKYYQKIARL